MNLLSINVSDIKTVDDRGKEVATGIFKQPVTGPIVVGKINLAGDDQADRRNHGGEHKAVYAFGQQHLPHWSRELGRDDLGPGFFGENLSVDTLDETTLRIGDHLTVGECRFQITQPRVPCFKLGLKAGVPALTRSFMMHGLTGVYLRVITAGSISTGDAMGHVSDETSHFTTAELFKAQHDRDAEVHWRIEVIEDALQNPALSSEWRTLIAKRLSQLQSVD